LITKWALGIEGFLTSFAFLINTSDLTFNTDRIEIIDLTNFAQKSGTTTTEKEKGEVETFFTRDTLAFHLFMLLPLLLLLFGLHVFSVITERCVTIRKER
jgi:hypothetical protein